MKMVKARVQIFFQVHFWRRSIHSNYSEQNLYQFSTPAVTNDHKCGDLIQIYYLIVCRSEAWCVSIKLKLRCLQAMGRLRFLLIQVVGKIQFLIIIGLRFVFSCCLQGVISSFQRTPHSFAHGLLPPTSKLIMAGVPLFFRFFPYSSSTSFLIFCFPDLLLRTCMIRLGHLILRSLSSITSVKKFFLVR